MAPTSFRRSVLIVASLALAASCVDEGDRAAKKRIFSPEEPSKAILAAAEPIDAGRLALDPALAWRVMTMGPAEALERVGPHRFSASVSFEWSSGKSSIALGEQRALEQARSGDFYLKTENDRDQGMEIVRVADQTFARSKYHKFRERKRDRGQAEEMREDVFGALRSAQSILGNRLSVRLDGEELLEGRPTRRYQFVLSNEPLRPASPGAAHLPPVQYPAQGPDEQTKRRVDFANLKVPKSAEGRLWVDIQSGVPLKSELTATVAAPGEASIASARLTLRVRSRVTPAEKIAVVSPKEYLPDEDRPGGIAAALERFGISRADGGLARSPNQKPAESEEVPED
jgi:hypothetical protein